MPRTREAAAEPATSSRTRSKTATTSSTAPGGGTAVAPRAEDELSRPPSSSASTGGAESKVSSPIKRAVADGDVATATAKAAAAAAGPGRLPGPVRFVLVVVLSFALLSLGRSFVDHVSDNEVGSIARETNSQTELGVLAAWKLFGLALGWLGDYDGFDLAALAVLSHGPATFLISVFYGIRSLTAGAYLAVDVVSAFLPFVLLRRLSSAHSAAPGVPNRDIVADKTIQVLTALQSSLVYSVVLFLAGRYLLPDYLVLYFSGIPTIRPAADATFLGLDNPTTLALSVLFGLAARTFIFTPLVTTPRTAEDEKNAGFDPVSATLGQTVAWNLWGYTSRTKVSLVRTAVAMLYSAVGTYLDTVLTVRGVELYGAVVYAGVWVLAALVTGLSLRYVGSI
ncbi:uncharacterized protein C8A04DRAFT_34516 [Dichotomopilus funicola]|uniref:Uncharacterized protein n=1 Tax=Dichotomopilus funicola TaxID=1934379 RepID=A0AAN6ZPJ1_9PEZI|nr:hypothetical protein C8A04DRAFT_34516 [Dichotomopilus funicola]